MLNMFKFTPGPNGRTYLENGQTINGASSTIWTERYRNAGDFEISTPLSSGLREFLPMGTLVSHTNTLEVMIVENHHIVEDPDADPVLKISGRSLEAYLEDRITGTNKVYASSLIEGQEYVLSAANTWTQAVTLINQHIRAANGAQGDNPIPYLMAETSITGTGLMEERSYPREVLYSTLTNLLGLENLGIKVVRMNSFGGDPVNTKLIIHRGVDRSAKIVFSVKAGDLDGAEYLWSQKPYRNAAMMVTKYFNTIVFAGGHAGFDLRYMVVDASDLDGHYDTIPPSGTVRNAIYAKMTTRGNEAIRNQNRLSLLKADISEVTKYQYRRDYNIGDLVMVDASYGQMKPMRIVEFTEIQDENDSKGHPTLEDPNPEEQ